MNSKDFRRGNPAWVKLWHAVLPEKGKGAYIRSAFAAPYISARQPQAGEGQILAFTGGSSLPKAAGDERAGVPRPSGRYVGRSARRPTEPRVTGARPGASSPPPRLQAANESPSSSRVHVPSLPWSLRLTVAVTAVLLLTLALRLVPVFASPIDAPVGVQATHALYVRVLAGELGGAPGPGGFPLGNQPWVGTAPTNPASGLPLFDWLVAGGLRLAGAGDWLGRLLAALFSVVAGLALFAVVRKTAGAVAGVYAALFFGVAPLSVALGGQYSPASLLLASQALAILALLNWHETVRQGASHGSSVRFYLALGAALLAALLDGGSLFLVAPAAYLIVASDTNDLHNPAAFRGPRAAMGSWSSAWARSANRARVVAYAASMLAGAAGWWLYSSKADSLVLGMGDGAGGVGNILANLLSGSSYIQLVGVTIGKLLTVLGLLLLFAGLLHGARQRTRGLFHMWLAAGLLNALLDAGRIGRHDDALLPLLLPACALVGIGASWAASLPSRVWLAMSEQPREPDAQFAVSPHTAWLFDLPEVRTDSGKLRPQARPALGKSVAARSVSSSRKARRAWLVALGHVAILGAFGLVGMSGWQAASAGAQPTAASVQMASAGQEIASLTDPGSRLIVAGPNASALFYSSRRTGWAIDENQFSILQVQQLQREGAAYLVSTDQAWLGQHPDYVGLLANYSVKKLAPGYILFDLNTPPTANDRLYFLESGHTLGGDFRRFWEANGGVVKLGYPISEEVQETNPLDGQQRTVQYFERAVLELHPEFAGTPNAVMRAAVGRWITVGRDFPRVQPSATSQNRAYFPQTGHIVKEAFLQYWQTQGGLAAFGYPISEELPEISPADGKVYTVQYFERARMEWHPKDAGTPNEVQLGLVGKQALEMRK